MTDQHFSLHAGVEPGLRFACVLDGRGSCTEIDWRHAKTWQPSQGFLWIHLERDTPEAELWLREESGLESLVIDALLNDESRPTIRSFDGDLLLVLRGVNFAEKNEVELVPIHIWIDERRAITLRDKDHALSALRDIRVALLTGRGPRRPGGLLVQICEKIVRDVAPDVETMDDDVEQLEEEVISGASSELRRSLADMRRRAVHLRRYLGPQREALIRLQTEDSGILDKHDRLRLRCCIDSLIRFLEDLDALRDRATILHEELAAQISEKISLTSNRLTALAALLLPPSLVAGLLGMNVGGIPGQQSPLAFWELTALMIVLLTAQAFILRRIGWL
ncbi:MAG: zinc transporter ZntB [Rhodospirillales bacterium]|nr:zinc transporter ZntB [Rhodospirillales bacterium]